MAMTIVPVVTMGWASVTRSARFSPFIPMTLLPFLFQPRVNFPDSSELTNGGAWTWQGALVSSLVVKSNLGEERIHLSVHFQRAVHHCGKSRQGLKAGTEAETKTLLARALSGPCSATFLTQSRLTCIEKVLLKSGCLLHQSSINLLSYCCNRTQGPKQHKKSHCLFYGVLLLRGSGTSLRSSQ